MWRRVSPYLGSLAQRSTLERRSYTASAACRRAFSLSKEAPAAPETANEASTSRPSISAEDLAPTHLGSPINPAELSEAPPEEEVTELPEAPPEGQTLFRDMFLFALFCAGVGFAWSRYRKYRDEYPRHIAKYMTDAKAHVIKAGQEGNSELRQYHLAKAEVLTRQALLALLVNLGAANDEASSSPQALHLRLCGLAAKFKNDPSIVSALCNLGRLCYDQRKWKYAADYYLLVLKALSEHFGFESIELIMPCRHLSDCYMELGQFSLAEHFLERALKIPLKGSEEYGQIQEQRAVLYRRQQLWNKSIECSNIALECARKNMGTTHQQVAAVLTGRALAQIEAGDVENAAEGAKLALGIVDTQPVDLPALKFNVLFVYGRALYAMGQPDEALRLLNEALRLSNEKRDSTKSLATLELIKKINAEEIAVPGVA